jgi:phosphoribosylanthranilate isomerase
VTKVKICGLTNLDDAAAALAAGADALGFILWRPSKRYVAPERVAEIVAALPPFAFTVGVFVDEGTDAMQAIRDRAGLSAIQLHGDEAPEILAQLRAPVLKAFRAAPDPATLARWPVAGFLADGAPAGQYGGTGHAASDALIAALQPTGRLVLAGGLNPDNVAARIAAVRPYAVDVTSGVEAAPGKKNQEAVRRFIAAVRAADYGK